MPTITNLPPLTIATGTVVFPVVDIDADPDITKKATFQQIKDFLESSLSVTSVAGRNGAIVLTYTDIGGLAAVAHTGSYSDLSNTPTQIIYTLPVATTGTLGGIKIGSGLTINTATGFLSANTQSVGTVIVNTATTVIQGTVIIGNGLGITSTGLLSLLTATTTQLGGIKIGEGLTYNNLLDKLEWDNRQQSPYIYLNRYETSATLSTVLEQAGIVITRNSGTSNAFFVYTDAVMISDGTTSTRGAFAFFTDGGARAVGLIANAIRVPSGTNEFNFFGAENTTTVISVKGSTNYKNLVTQNYHIPNKEWVENRLTYLTTASTTTLGVVRIGSGINVTNTGTISVTPFTLTTATTSTIGGVKIDGTTIVINNGVISGANQYVLVTATQSVLGGVKIGAGIGLDIDGTISVTTASFALQTATQFILGGVKIGAGIGVVGDGTISVNTFTGGSVANSTQFLDTTASTSTTTGAVTIAGGLGIRGSVNVANTVTAGSFVSSTAGTPEVYSASNLNLVAVGRVQVTQSPFKVWNVSSSTRATISASNGDMIYNTDNNKFQGYANGSWVDLH